MNRDQLNKTMENWMEQQKNKAIVFAKNGEVFTDSLMVAEKFNKTHDNVLRDIKTQLKKLEEAGEREWGVINFEETHYQHPQNQQWYPKYDLTEDAFAIIAMSYVTPEAMKMKVRFLEEFKRMRQQLQNGVPTLSPNEAMAIALRQTAEMMTVVPKLENRIDTVERKVEEQITLDSGEQRRLQKAVNVKVCSIEPIKECRAELFRQLHREIKDRWDVPSYKDVRRQDLSRVLRYVDAWVPKKAN
ncbi:Rha family transcriptional regulator [Paenibacillus apiarius]|uniref:Rha family transcriptional regulator n=1 Tax=Paenibacillus apiarius TaxID=46240 RepID=A0ABT4DVJ4_9BACL|nr:Rha family transcriptional regulator [Paenibacillus apiarius]MCY9513269.1 Rha family transcriptional regulator [Paenibacillus apiarius]MCY9521372.1 Rha family transcriptional regulator [Paenibacillus apiarius]MCY9554482.1 Rha family transcriptional regulator [Paenibacillus apiarius]MCY9560685.1 Rha family transcriptional regulator [Paenibacillus apiarius]MCY9685064.1 Rha family transcriptional regulator [Paenibacillus apiarius]